MTDKQQNILMSALELFAEQGYAATSTARIAKAAGVSEGLIFRHFENKEGLLRAIMERGKEEASGIFNRVFQENDPQQRIATFLQIPFQLDPSAYPFWKLLYSLKWQTGFYEDEIGAPLLVSLTEAFQRLGNAQAEIEAQCLLIWMDGIATQLLLHQPDNKDEIMQSILRRYGV